jgi:DNA (cytosine-5)-methyltransferase 1
MKSFGYDFDYKLLNAANFGAFTSRERYFAQFVKYGVPISWPKATHSKKGGLTNGICTEKWKPVKEVLDLNDEGKSIFTRKKPPCDNTCKRLFLGLNKYAKEEMFLTAYYKGGGQLHSINEPCATIPTKDRFALATCHFMDKQYGNGSAQSINTSAGTITTTPKLNLVSINWLMDMSFNNIGTPIEKPCPTIIARQDKKPLYLVSANSGINLIEIKSTDSPYMQKIKEFCNENKIVDVKTRMLKIIELKRITGFSENYILVGRMDEQKKFIGNAVEVKTFKAIIEAIASGLITMYKSKAA